MGCCCSSTKEDGAVEDRRKEDEAEEKEKAKETKTDKKNDNAKEQQGSTGSNTNANTSATTNAKRNSNSNGNLNNATATTTTANTNANNNDNKKAKTNSVIDTKQGDNNPSDAEKESKPRENGTSKNNGAEAEQVIDNEYEMYLKRDVFSLKNLFEKYAKVKSVEIEDEQYMNKEGLENALLSLGIKLVGEDTKHKVFGYFNFKSAEEETAEEVGSKVGCIDLFDFCSCLNAFIDENDHESASILFLCFDWDHDGLLTPADVIRLLLTQHLLLATAQGGFHNSSVTRYSKSDILDRSRALFRQATDQTNPVTHLTLENFMAVRNA